MNLDGEVNGYIELSSELQALNWYNSLAYIVKDKIEL